MRYGIKGGLFLSLGFLSLLGCSEDPRGSSGPTGQVQVRLQGPAALPSDPAATLRVVARGAGTINFLIQEENATLTLPVGRWLLTGQVEDEHRHTRYTSSARAIQVRVGEPGAVELTDWNRHSLAMMAFWAAVLAGGLPWVLKELWILLQWGREHADPLVGRVIASGVAWSGGLGLGAGLLLVGQGWTWLDATGGLPWWSWAVPGFFVALLLLEVDLDIAPNLLLETTFLAPLGALFGVLVVCGSTQVSEAGFSTMAWIGCGLGGALLLRLGLAGSE